MVAFTFPNWLQATAINVVTREGKPQVMPSDESDVKHCKEGDISDLDIRYNETVK